ncbi:MULTISPECIES: holin family protein [Bacillus]|uniref:Phage holin family protein n=1 Tax=Bacillus spizizenii TaxID=96241 RepID=A0A9Q4DSJ7_BACSC|nr:phage holin family protein [Bacillus vallismortis]MCY7961372.1 phage holin family protein [Bacillus spizizenii]MCY8123249.1 phage holin family protein [Bacillus spizizenii]MCY8546812.1 phage holin family protein [Bacillus vallismortis]MEC0581901.1 phage holin family protein [Bacillus spizizenii]MEC0631864.1 phage holin family protein [Bacillus spizizenii]
MKGMDLVLNIETLEIAKTYLFGGVKYLDLLLLLSFIDVFTGVVKAVKDKSLRSRNAWFGYVRKFMSFVVVILANIVDQICNLNGVLVFGTVLFYIANEGLSIVENLAQMGVKVPGFIKDKLQVIEEDSQNEKSAE